MKKQESIHQTIDKIIAFTISEDDLKEAIQNSKTKAGLVIWNTMDDKAKLDQIKEKYESYNQVESLYIMEKDELMKFKLLFKIYSTKHATTTLSDRSEEDYIQYLTNMSGKVSTETPKM